MGFVLIIIGAALFAVSIFIGAIFGFRLCLNAVNIIPFTNEYKSTKAEIIGFDSNDIINGKDDESFPILKFFNEYQGKEVKKSLIKSALVYQNEITDDNHKYAAIGDMINIDYTKNAVRVNDTRFITQKQLSFAYYFKPIIFCFLSGIIGVIVLIIGIISR